MVCVLEVHYSPDPGKAHRQAAAFLAAEPVKRNLLSTLVAARVHSNDPPGHYWWTTQNGRVVGFAMQSPVTFKAVLDAESDDVVDALAAKMHETNSSIPALTAAAWASARCAGAWTEHSGGGAVPTEGERLYELESLRPPTAVPGAARRAELADAQLVADWHVGFCADTGIEPFADPLATMSSRIRDRRIWIWQHDEAVAMAAATPATAGASRIAHVYTPPANRGNGYGSAVTASATADALSEGADCCLLYTDLANATSNSIYRRIGYRPLEERLTYRFDSA